MTAQQPDNFQYNGELFAVIGLRGDNLPHPSDFGLEVMMWSTACYRGYVATYSCDDHNLLLKELHIGHLTEDSEWVSINGVEPETQFSSGYTYVDGEKQSKTWENGKKYQNLNVETYFSGGILIARGFIQSLYVHMGFGKPYQYEQVYELLFHEGTLTQEIDHSERAAAWRDQILQHREEMNIKAEALRKTGLSEREITQALYGEQPSREEIAKNVEWRFSLDYGDWFM